MRMIQIFLSMILMLILCPYIVLSSIREPDVEITEAGDDWDLATIDRF